MWFAVVCVAAWPWEKQDESTVVKFRSAVSQGEVKEAIRLAPRVYGEWWSTLVRESPEHVAVETLLIIFVVFLLMAGKRKPAEKLTKAEMDELIREWEPEPLVPASRTRTRIVEKWGAGTVTINSKELVNAASLDFLGLGCDVSIREAAKQALAKYGCGSCGPRGFYGSIDVHEELEERIAAYFGVEKAIAFSDASSCVTSTVAAFAKRGDLLVVDDGASEPLRTGCVLSRATVITFKHGDMADLERVMASVAEDDQVKRRKQKQRRFVVAEAVDRDHGGCVLPLQQVIKLKNQYGYRLILDEGLSVWAQGIARDVEVTTVDLGPALGSVGGLCLGTAEVIDHQRLSGAGYCFSAAAPPFVSAAALQALDILQADNGQRLSKLQENVAFVHSNLAHVPGKLPGSTAVVAIKHDNLDTLYDIADQIANRGFAVAVSGPQPTTSTALPPMRPKPLALRIAVSARHTRDQLSALCDAVVDAFSTRV